MPHDADDRLTGEELLLIPNALEAFLPALEDGGHWSKFTLEEVQRWEPCAMLRRSLKTQIGMSFFDRPGRRLKLELHRERIAFGDKLFGRLCDLLKDPKASRRNIREGFGAAYQLREDRQSEPRPGL